MRTGVFLAILAVLVAGSPPAWAQRDDRRVLLRDGQVMPLDRLLPSIRRSHPGTFYDAEGPFPGPGGDYRYRLKWMTPDGRVIWLNTDARTGRVLGVEGAGRDYYQERYGRDRAGVGAPYPTRRDRDEPPRRQRFDGNGNGGPWDRGDRGGGQHGNRGGQPDGGYDRGGGGRHHH